jgi:amino acid transporter
MEKNRKTFVREATGLVRELSALDVALFNFAILGFLFSVYYALALMPLIGGNYALAIVITALLSALVLYSYYSFNVIMPRSGGDYVYVSRTLWPALGFVCNASFVLILLIYNGITGVTIQSTGISVGLTLVGSLLKNPTLSSYASMVIQPFWLVSLGTVEIVLLSLLSVLGKRVYFRLQNVVYILVFIASLIMIGLLLTHDNADFQSAFNSYSAGYANTTNYYQQIITTAQRNGWSPPETGSLYHTLLLVPVLSIFGTSFYSSTYLGGEIKRVSRSSMIGMLAAMFFAFLLAGVFIGAAYNTIGVNFLSALDYQISVSGLAIPVLPYINFLSLLLTNNPLLIIFVVVIGIIQMAIYIPAFYSLGSRSLMAYSFDRILPKFFAHVSDRFHTPTYSVAVLVVLSEVSLILLNIPKTAAAIYLFSTVLTWYGALFPIFFVGLASFLFPFIKREWFESSSANKKLGGVPVMSLTGLGTMFFGLFITYLELTNSVFAANTPSAIYTVAGFVVTFFVIFYVAKTMRSREGTPLELAFKEIPPE